jgi:aldehyde dehydrogenase (NAD+)
MIAPSEALTGTERYETVHISLYHSAVMVQKQLFINNEASIANISAINTYSHITQYVDASSDETIAIYSPHDESLVADGIQVASQADVDKAVAAARAALHGEWSKWTAEQRRNVLLKFADLIDKNSEMLASWEAKSIGQPTAIAMWIYKLVAQTFR